MAQDVKVATMVQTDHVDADRVLRTAFGTFLGMPDPRRSWALSRR